MESLLENDWDKRAGYLESDTLCLDFNGSHAPDLPAARREIDGTKPEKNFGGEIAEVYISAYGAFSHKLQPLLYKLYENSLVPTQDRGCRLFPCPGTWL